MTDLEAQRLTIIGAITELPAAERDACKTLVHDIQGLCQSANVGVAMLALAFVTTHAVVSSEKGKERFVQKSHENE